MKRYEITYPPETLPEPDDPEMATVVINGMEFPRGSDIATLFNLLLENRHD